jgi:hypothetical protein
MSARLCGGGLGVLSDQRDQDQGTKMPEPGQDQAKVVAGRRQDQVDRVAVFAGEAISLQQAIALVDRPEMLKRLLAPYPAENMAMWPVDKRVGNVRNNDPALIEPVALA